MSTEPVITLPSAITVDEDSVDNAVGSITVDDFDGENLTVTLSAQGTMTLGQLAGLTFSVGDGISDNTMTFTGSASDINAALASITYSPAADDDDGDTINVILTGTEQTGETFSANLNLSSLLAANGGDGSDGFVIEGLNG